MSRCATESDFVMGCPRCHNLMVEETFVDLQASPSVWRPSRDGAASSAGKSSTRSFCRIARVTQSHSTGVPGDDTGSHLIQDSRVDGLRLKKNHERQAVHEYDRSHSGVKEERVHSKF